MERRPGGAAPIDQENAMKMITLSALAAAIAFAPLAITSAAMPPSPTPVPEVESSTTPSFSELDRNNDGVLTQDEVPADHELANLFARYDHDGDLSINRSEFDLYMQGDEAVASDAEDDDDSEEER
jgi:hypothetical protein